ncbi:site-2 protease family protein [Candidatus Poribacteria bacterium]|nr:site-2 protease family protein [Candidatus Poribacteria bacterium]MCH2575534.1 site-2 protease family protein [Candidatus Poribacteria bacterium]|tara:strand:+ start:306 stop:980 length:675 start_codon:yes stop_codon:yes gene_type:complete
MENQIFLAIISVVQFVVLLTFHEWAHAKSANLLGDRTAEDLGRMSLNPAVHIDILGTVILPLMGALTGFPVIGWAKPVPVDPRNLINPKRDMMLIAGAGPAINIFCAILIYVCLRLITGEVGSIVSAEKRMLIGLLELTAFYSVILAVFNMLPLYPLDGFSVVYGLLPSSAARKFARLQQYGMPILMGLIFVPYLLRFPSPLRLLLLLARGICSLLGLLVGYPA